MTKPQPKIAPQRRRPLGIERLESRRNLAVVAFEVNLYEDSGGVPGALLAGDSIAAGDSFFLEITAQENSYFSGLQGVALDIAWNPQAIEFADATFDPQVIVTENLPLVVSGTLDREGGVISDLGGSALPAWNEGRAIGDGVAERFALLHFRALAAGEATQFLLGQGDSRIATLPVSNLLNSRIRFETQTLQVVEAAPPVAVPPAAQPVAEPSFDTPPQAAEPSTAAESAESSSQAVAGIPLGPWPIGEGEWSGPDLPWENPSAIPAEAVYVADPPVQSSSGQPSSSRDFAAAVDVVFAGPAAMQNSPFTWSLDEVLAAISSQLEFGVRPGSKTGRR